MFFINYVNDCITIKTVKDLNIIIVRNLTSVAQDVLHYFDTRRAGQLSSQYNFSFSLTRSNPVQRT